MEGSGITTKFVRKPLYVDAVQVTEQNFAEICRWCFGEIGNIDDSPVNKESLASDGPQPSKQYIRVRVHNPKNPRQTKAFVGDWLLYTERGYKVYTTKAFQANFDPVPQPSPLDQLFESTRKEEESDGTGRELDGGSQAVLRDGEPAGGDG